MIRWFYDSIPPTGLKGHGQADLPCPVIAVDSHFQGGILEVCKNGIHTSPKPTVWQGEHRLTKENWFAAANARNTALCLCKTTHIAYVDDLSVLQSGWYQAAREAAELNDTITCGAYLKVKSLVVENGVAVSYDTYPGGMDNRLKHARTEISQCGGNWLYGCSLVAPVDALLAIDGWGEYCDGLGFEDCCTGLVLANAGYKLRYDKRLMTLESDELHFVEPPMLRSDYGISPNDKSHAALNIALQSKTFDNGYVGGLRAERERVLRGEPFTVRNNPQHEWYSGVHLSELKPQ